MTGFARTSRAGCPGRGKRLAAIDPWRAAPDLDSSPLFDRCGTWDRRVDHERSRSDQN